jgi:hypothetical protein
MGAALSIFLVSTAGLVGALWTLLGSLDRAAVDRAGALGAGLLLGSALFGILPAAFAASERASLYVTVGFVGLYLVRSVLVGLSQGERPSAWALPLGLSLHALVDGIAFGITLGLDPVVRIPVVIAFIVHKVPEGFGLAAAQLAATDSRMRALFAVVALCAATLVGVLSALAWGRWLTSPAWVGLAAGSFVYAASAEMLPGVKRSAASVWLLLVGVMIVYFLTGGLHHGH